jgi:hypothetical protein
MDNTYKQLFVNASYLGIRNAIRWLVAQGKISREDGKKTAEHVAEKLGVSLLSV